MSETKQRKQKWMKPLMAILCVALGMAIAFVITHGMPEMGKLSGFTLTQAVLIPVAVFLTLVLLIPLHELVHLLMGLLTGYRPYLFSIFGLQWILRSDGKWHFQTRKLAGAGGLCGMRLPKGSTPEKYPYRLYALGGVLMTGVLSVLLVLGFLQPETVQGTVMLSAGSAALLSTLVNAVPRTQMQINDGAMLQMLRRSEQARRVYWLTEQVLEALLAEQRLSDMPEEWFQALDAPENALAAKQNINAVVRWVLKDDDDGALQLIHQQLEAESPMTDADRMEMVTLGATLEVLTAQKGMCLAEYVTPNFQCALRPLAKKGFVMLSRYAVHLLHDGDEQKADRARMELQALIAKDGGEFRYELEVKLLKAVAAKWTAEQEQNHE